MSYKLVVAHSSPSVHKAIRLAFPEQDYDIYAFEDGVEVMQELNQINPDAILLSLSLHEEEGYDIGRYLKNQDKFKHIPLILLYGAFEVLNEERVGSLVYDHLIQEPFDSQKLVRVVFDLIGKHRGPQTLPEEPSHDELIPSLSPMGMDARVKDLVRREIVEVERELEKRIRARILSDLNDYRGKK